MATTTTQKVKIKVKEHPRAGLYVGRQTREHLNGIMKFMASSPKIPDVDRVGAFLKKLKKERVPVCNFGSKTQPKPPEAITFPPFKRVICNLFILFINSNLLFSYIF